MPIWRLMPHCNIVGLCLLLSPGSILAQRVSFGFTGGVNLTRDFPTSREVYFDTSRPQGLTAFER